MAENIITLKSIHELLPEKFYVPAYQRGYRWTNQQVTDLLDDIWDFHQNPPKHEDGKEKPFYCLQPIVVMNKNGEWEVIDGQQRLTAVFILLKYFNERLADEYKQPAYCIRYETREDSAKYLELLDAADKDKNIDYFFIYNTYLEIRNWFKDRQQIVDDFKSTMLNRVKVIWYQVNEEVNAIDIFTRINMGKIPLTNAELIKALFLRKSNFPKEGEDKVRLKQLQIAGEWDRIEYELQHDSFWYFINDNVKDYSTRIEFIFDLMKEKTPEDVDEYFTFHKFNADFEREQNIELLWKEVKKCFMTFEEWYDNRELYHLIGFLIAAGSEIRELRHVSLSRTKIEFRERLKDEIKNSVKCKISDLEYGDKYIKPVLLLFNIQTLLDNEKCNFRFPFDIFKKEEWDIEHIRSVMSDKPANINQKKLWLQSVLEYFTGIGGRAEEQSKALGALDEQEEGLMSQAGAMLAKEDFSAFDTVYDEILDHFKEMNEPENINSISNLALLDSSTNRSYRNAVFPIKRKTILRNDKNGTFIPICTKNVFLKYYSRKIDDMMFWTDADSRDYLENILTTLNSYLPKQEETGD